MQVQGSMYVTGLKHWDFLAYHPDMKPLLLTVGRDARIIDALDIALNDFIATMLRERDILRPQNTAAALEASLERLNERHLSA